MILYELNAFGYILVVFYFLSDPAGIKYQYFQDRILLPLCN